MEEEPSLQDENMQISKERFVCAKCGWARFYFSIENCMECGGVMEEEKRVPKIVKPVRGLMDFADDKSKK